jgi:mxaK protein
MALSTSWLSKIAALLLLISLGMLATIGWQLYQAYDYNQAIAAEDWSRAAKHPSANGELAAAYDIASRRSPDDFQATVHQFAQVISSADSEIKHLARYNLATLYLERGLQLLANEQFDIALPLLELAKEIFRERLRADPKHWDSKYNLAQALRAAPDKAEAKAPSQAPNPGPSNKTAGVVRSKKPLP